ELFYSSGLGAVALARKLKTKKSKIYKWKNAERSVNGRRLIACIPADAVKTLALAGSFPCSKIEKNVVAYHCRSGLKFVAKPRLPIVEDERLIRILVP
ncbi:MAG: hypothetical protein V1817_04330, partial [Candidatus Micrarchaeota archaeon]